ncbi:MAG: GuaB3 family IMP dehydrogenase-related protein [Chloroflexi bacterium]|nr:GuaB3 family IMP dehydrogenase-related protein [Chloroflexota bacterium]
MYGPRFKELRRAYGFEDVAIVPGEVTINPDLANTSFTLGQHTFSIPVLASAMDGAVDPAFAIKMGQLGGLAVLNLEGVHGRYDNPDEVLDQIAQASKEEITPLFQKIYSAPIKEAAIGSCITKIKDGNVVCAVSVTPQNTKRLAPVAVEAGADILVVQSTVTTARHVSRSYKGLIFSEFCQQISIPVVVGNSVGYNTALELMETGIEGLLVGVGPGAACTSREVLGIGVPQISATIECAAARDEYARRAGRYVAVITDGGIRTGGDLCKSVAAGADAVMLGTPLAQAYEAPGRGYNWGMASPHPTLPRGIRIEVGTKGSLEQILMGPSSVTDGTQNLIGALRTAMGICGALTIKDMHQAEMIIAPSIKTEGKIFQMRQLLN